MSGMNDKAWEPEEIGTIKRMMAEGADDEQISKALNRSINSIKAKRRRILLAEGPKRESRVSNDAYFVDIDGDKLRGKLSERGISLAAASKEIGFSESVVAQACRTGRLKKPALLALQALYGIKYEDVEPEKKREETTELTKEGRDYLYKIVYAACREAMEDFRREEE